MIGTSKGVALNRPVFTQRAFDSGGLTVLTTLLHHFAEPGRYDVLVHRDGTLAGRLSVRVARDNAEHQINVDMAALGEEKGDCGCGTEPGYELAFGGVLGFFVSAGTARYTVTIEQLDDQNEEKRTWLESSRVVPQGDFFALTLVRPGIYRAVETESGSELEIRVELPRDKSYRPDQPTLVTLGKDGGYDRSAVDLLSGQSVVFQCNAPARIRAELIKPDDSAGEPIRGARFMQRRPRARAPRRP